MCRDTSWHTVRQFAQGQWGSLIRDSVDACEIASRNRARRTRRPVNDVAKRAERAKTLVMMGEVSAGRQALEGAALAPGNMTTLNQLNNPDRRPVQPIRELPPREFKEFEPVVPFKLNEHRFAQNVRSARRGAAPGPSGMTNDHLRILLSNPSHFQWLFRAAEQLARGDILAAVVDVVRLGRMPALQKPDGGVRGIVVGDVLRRLVGRTIAQQLVPAVEDAPGRTWTHLDTPGHTWTHLPTPVHTSPHLPTPAHTCPHLPTPAHTCPQLRNPAAHLLRTCCAPAAHLLHTCCTEVQGSQGEGQAEPRKGRSWQVF